MLVGWLFRSCGGVPVCSLAVVLAFAALPLVCSSVRSPVRLPLSDLPLATPEPWPNSSRPPSLVQAVEEALVSTFGASLASARGARIGGFSPL
jgi:hypothetical protein